MMLQRYPEAEPLLQDALTAAAAAEHAEAEPTIRVARQRLAELYDMMEMPERAAEYRLIADAP